MMTDDQATEKLLTILRSHPEGMTTKKLAKASGLHIQAVTDLPKEANVPRTKIGCATHPTFLWKAPATADAGSIIT